MNPVPRFLAVLILVSGFAASAGATSLGDPAPELKVAEWIKGEPITLAKGKGKNVFVVEFWATWCGPCRQTIPHLSEIQRKHKDKGLVVIGVTDEKADKVKPFVEKLGDKMDYRVVIESGATGPCSSGAMSQAYMAAFKENGIPHAFIVDREGRLVWHGHPMDDMDSVLEKVLAGKFDLEATRRSEAERQESAEATELMSEYYQLAMAGDKKADFIGEKILKSGAKSKDALGQFAFLIAKAPNIRTRNYELGMRAADAAHKLDPKDPRVLGVYALMQHENGKKEEAIKNMTDAIAMCDADEPNLKAAFERELARFKGKPAGEAIGAEQGEKAHAEKPAAAPKG